MALGLILSALPAAAQEVFSLPPGTASPTARPPGPVDSDSPVVRTGPTPAPQTSPAATPAASAGPTRAAIRRAPRQTTTARSSGTATPSASALVLPGVPSPTAATPTTLPAVAPAPSAAAPAAGPAPASQWTAFATGALVGALALLALVGGLIWRRRKPGAADQLDFEPPIVPAPQPEPIAAPAPAPAPAPKPTPVAQPEGLQITLEARRLDASLLATTLAYQVRLTNNGTTQLSALAIEGDMVAAHSTLPVDQQIANPDQKLELRHALIELAPGESAEFKGEMRLPLTAITPIRAGNAAYFVPLARLRVEAAQADNVPVVIAQTFVIGDLPEQPGGALRPFRLDLGPRTYGKLGQRAVD